VQPEPRRVLIAVSIAIGACGDDAPTGGGPAVPCDVRPAQRYLPLAIGTSWTYDTSDSGAPSVVKTQTVEALEDVGDRKVGTTAYRLRTTKERGGDVVSWQEDRCTSVVRHREQTLDANGVLLSDQFYVPSKLRVDETALHLLVGAAWSTAYTEVEVDPVDGTHTVSKTEAWTVEAVDEAISVPAGTFTCLRVRKVTSGDADKTFWFAPGIGKIKEQGEQVEALTSYVPGATP
jgi:hypothetical protein